MSDDKDKKPQAEKPVVQQDETFISLNAQQPMGKVTETPKPPKPKP